MIDEVLTPTAADVEHAVRAPSTGNGQPAAHSPPVAQPSTGTANSKPRKSGGAPSGNSNATTHGLKGSKFPPGAIREQTTVRAIVLAAKAACEAKHGHPVTVHQMAVLHRLRRAATKDRLSARWLRLEAATLTIEQRIALVEAQESSAETIEKCLRQLGLDGAGAATPDLWAKVDEANKEARLTPNVQPGGQP